MFNKLKLYLTELESLSVGKLVAEAKKFIRHAVNCYGLECLS